MSDREILHRWLATAAARLGWSRRMRELGRFACALLALVLLAQILKALGAPAPVLSALAPLLVVGALALVSLCAWRLTRPTTLAQAAGAADTRAGLKDELKSAHWFAQRATRDAPVDLLLTRAAQTAQRLDARRLFPLRAPRGVLAALALAIFTGSLAWFSPRIALPVMQETVSALAPAAKERAGADAAGRDNGEKLAAPPAFPDSAAKHDLSATRPQLEPMPAELPAGAEKGTAGRAVAAHDARLVAQRLEALARAPGDAIAPDSAPRPDAQSSTEATHGGQKTVSDQEDKALRAPAAAAATQRTVRVRQKLTEQIREEQRKLEGQPAQGQVTRNNRLRAVARSSVRRREVAYAEGEAGEAGSQTSVDGAATGERTGRSRAGGSEGEHPHSSPTGEGDNQPVLGEPTVRLEARLQKARVEREDQPRHQEAEEAFYAATQRHASQVEYQDIAAQWRAQRETPLAPGHTPLPYREAVKRYFLTQHGKEQ